MLTRHFLRQSAKQLGVAEPKRISDAALQKLSSFGFPGNVRQLENICHWLTVMAPAQVIETKDLPPEVLDAVPEPLRAPAPVLVESGAVVRHPPLTSEATAGAATDIALAEKVSFAPADLGVPLSGGTWETGLEAEAMALLATGRSDVWDVLTRRFESRLIQTALLNTRGRRIEAALGALLAKIVAKTGLDASMIRL